MIIKRIDNIIEEKKQEIANAEVVKNKANIDYVAMMSDIEIPTEEEHES